MLIVIWIMLVVRLNIIEFIDDGRLEFELLVVELELVILFVSCSLLMRLLVDVRFLGICVKIVGMRVVVVILCWI